MKRIKVYLVLIGLLVILLALKTNLLDGYEPVDSTERIIHALAAEELREGFIFHEKIVSMGPLSEQELKRVEGELDHNYKVIIRQYLLRFLAIRERIVTY